MNPGTECHGASIVTTTHQSPSWHTCHRCSAPVTITGALIPPRDMDDTGLMDALKRAWGYEGDSADRVDLINGLLGEATRRVKRRYPGAFTEVIRPGAFGSVSQDVPLTYNFGPRVGTAHIEGNESGLEVIMRLDAAGQGAHQVSWSDLNLGSDWRNMTGYLPARVRPLSGISSAAQLEGYLIYGGTASGAGVDVPLTTEGSLPAGTYDGNGSHTICGRWYTNTCDPLGTSEILITRDGTLSVITIPTGGVFLYFGDIYPVS